MQGQFQNYDKPSSLGLHFPYSTNKAVDLLEKLMNIDPKERITAKDALEHPFFK